MLQRIFSKENKALLSELVRTDFKLRYQGSVLGYAWSLLKPLFMFAILYVVFGVVLRVGDSVENFPVYLLFGIVLWNFFEEITQQSLTSIVMRGDLIQKIAIPRWQIILSTSISAIINFVLNFMVIILIALATGMNFLSSSILLPLYVVEIYLFALGCSLVLSALYVKYRDLSYIWDIVLQAGFYATPILYPLSFITSETAQKIMFINPLAHAIQGARKVFITSDSVIMSDVWGGWAALLIPVAVVIVCVAFGVAYFRKESVNFAENL